jgi:YbbR domain-containing protein
MAFDLRKALVTNWPIKATALALATVLWAAVAAREPTTQIVDVSLRIQAPPGKIIVTPQPAVQASFNGTAGELFKLFLNPPAIRKAIPETHTGSTFSVELSPGDLTLATEAAVAPQWVRPRRFDVELDSLIQRYVAVEPQVTVEADSGYELVGPVVIQPESIAVSGPLSVVSTMTSIRTTAFELTGLSAPLEGTVPFDTAGLRQVRLSVWEASVSADVREIVLASKVLENIIVRIVPPRGGLWVSEPRQVTVTLTGPQRRIAAMTADSVRVTAGPLASGPTETVSLTVQVPDGFEAETTPDTVVVHRQDRGA